MTARSPKYQPSLTPQSPKLLHLPVEILLKVASFLPKRDLKSLRLTNKRLDEIVPLSFSRVFLSANSLDIKVFRSVANHPIFREQVTEIIWDDARFIPDPDPWVGIMRYRHPARYRSHMVEEGYPEWFQTFCKRNIEQIKTRKGRDVDTRPDHVARQQQADAQLPLKVCWDYYSEILKDQQAVMESQDDEKAFVYGLLQFPNLKRVTVTPLAHGRVFCPLYDTPTIRKFPYGFNHPTAWGWQIALEGDYTCTLPMGGYMINPSEWDSAKEDYKEQWRGARIVLRVLATVKEHNVSELIFDSKQIPGGLNATIFAQPCEEYSHFAAIMKRPGFHHLHLSLLVGEHGFEYVRQNDIGLDYGIYQHKGLTSGLLAQAIGSAKELTHLHLKFTITEGGGNEESLIPLKEILPVQQWPKLRHLGLEQFTLEISDLIDLLRSASPLLRSVELGTLWFSNDEENWSRLLERMRDELDWTKRDQALRPAVKIIMSPELRHRKSLELGRCTLLSDEVTNFLYESGEIPTDGDKLDFPKLGMGIMHDNFEPEWARS